MQNIEINTNITVFRRSLLMLLVTLILLIAHKNADATVVIGGYTFADNAFPDVLLAQSGTFNLGVFGSTATTLQDAVLGSNLNTAVMASSSDAYYTVGYTDNVVRNIPGPDIAFFELLINDNFYVEINGIRRLVDTQFDVGQGPLGILNLGLVDLDDFGIAPGGTIDRITMWIGSNWSPSEFNPAITISGAAIPEPATVGLLGLGSLCLLRKRRR